IQTGRTSSRQPFLELERVTMKIGADSGRSGCHGYKHAQQVMTRLQKIVGFEIHSTYSEEDGLTVTLLNETICCLFERQGEVAPVGVVILVVDPDVIAAAEPTATVGV